MHRVACIIRCSLRLRWHTMFRPLCHAVSLAHAFGAPPTGLVQGDGSGGFSAADKDFVVSCLRRLERSAAWGLGRSQLGVVSSRLIKFARVPVLKLQLEGGLELDVSLNDDGGINAARFLQSFVSGMASATRVAGLFRLQRGCKCNSRLVSLLQLW